MKMREIEYYRLWTGNGGDSGTWDTDFVAIPSDTPEEAIEAAVKEAVRQIKWQDDVPVIYGVYSVPDLDENPT